MTNPLSAADPLGDLLARFPNLPDVAGEGLLFAFSGLDGATCTASGFVAAIDGKPFNLLIHTPQRRRLRLQFPSDPAVAIATGDVLAGRSANTPVVLTWTAWHTLVGAIPADASAELVEEDEVRGEAEAGGVPRYVADGFLVGVVVLRTGPGRIALAWGKDSAEATARADAGLNADPWAIAGKRLEWFRKVPPALRSGRERLLNKCAAVMRVNSCTTEGSFRQAWSTPDRVPHRHCWLWDSCFHSVAMAQIEPATAWSWLKSMLDAQTDDGMVPITTTVAGTKLGKPMTQPPLLAWAVLETVRAGGDRAAATWAVPRLERYLEWDLRNRDRNRNDLLEWDIEGNPRCRSGESGLDNSPRFDEAGVVDAVDFSVFAAHDCLCLADLHQMLGKENAAEFWRMRSRAISQQVHAQLWNHDHGFYEDRDLQGRFTGVRAVSGFMPLLLPDLPADRARRLVTMLDDPAHFAAPVPVPSVSLSHPTFSTDMWRGPMWVNMNYFIVHGLRRHGLEDRSVRLAEATLTEVERRWRESGVLFEFFDAKGAVAPPACDRKGPVGSPFDYRRRYSVIRDYHWTAALTACLLWGR
ncbi:hypothetical protein LBMAG53_34010 [Planctomycetota bacterium]|nr:hypothetical protein LBMAG53_34010 [Planctomycetota bacterium]